MLQSLKKKIKSLISTPKEAAPADNPAKLKKEDRIQSVMRKTGWTREETISKIEAVIQRTGMTYADYDKRDFHTVADDAVEEEYFKINWKVKQRENCISKTMEKTGWSRPVTIARINATRDKLGITYNDYSKYRFYKIPEEEQAARYAEIVKQKEARKEESRARSIREREHHIQTVMDATGWDRQLTLDMQRRCSATAGCDYEHYAVYRLYDLPEEEQMTYFTARYTRALRKRYNIDPEIIHIFRNKDQTCELLKDFLGRAWMSTVDMSLEDFRKTFANETKIIYKPLASYGGKGVEVFALSQETVESVYNELMTMPDGIVEGFLKQHPEMAKLSVKSVNTIRVATVKSCRDYPNVEKDKLYIVYAGLRMGSGSSYVDNLHSGGLIGGIDLNTGIVETDGVDFQGNPFPVHPDTGVTIKGFQIPYWEEMKQMLNEASKNFKTGYFGWDIAISETGPVIIEVNTSPGSVILQTPYIPVRRGMGHLVAPYVDPRDVAPKYPLQPKEEKYITMIMEATGQSREEALAGLTDHYVRFGIQADQYALNKMWELTEDFLATAFTTRDNNLLRARFNRYSNVIEPLYDKVKTCQYLNAYLHRPWLATEGMTLDAFKETFAGQAKIIFKPLSSSGGKGIEVFQLNEENLDAVYNKISTYPKGILEGYVTQHPDMQRLFPNSVNTIRVVALKTQEDIPGVRKDAVNIVYTTLRCGSGEGYVDNLSNGGLAAIINKETGIVETNAVDNSNKPYASHPDTSVQFVGFAIPCFEQILPFLEEVSKTLPGYFLGWDIAITENGPVIIEVNTNPGFRLLQAPYIPERKGMKHEMQKYLA